MQLLENIFWHSLVGPHALYSSGTATARRYVPGFSPFIGFADNEQPDFAALAPYCEPDAHFYCGGWSGSVPSGWRIHADLTGYQMVWDGAAPAVDETLAAVQLGPEHVAQILDLVALTNPGPFAARTIELGVFFGVFDAGRLIAMAGERTQAGALREISGVCTHPDSQGRGLARRLVLKLIRIQKQRDQIPFLHVRRDNVTACRAYERMGFRLHREVALRIVSRESGA